jgi:hypothetical protein
MAVNNSSANKMLNNAVNNVNAMGKQVSVTKLMVLLSVLFVALVPGVILTAPGKTQLIEIGTKPMWTNKMSLIVHAAVFFLAGKMLYRYA